MKRLSFIITLVLAAMTVSAQESLTAGGTYECKEVFTAEGVPASSLYVRALETLSDWAGSQQKSKASIDVQDKDEGLVIYKGQLYLGFKKVNSMCGYDVYADFTMKARCKEGKVQLTAIVPSMSFYWTCTDDHETVPLSGIYPEFKAKTRLYHVKKSAQAYIDKLFTDTKEVVHALGTLITHPADDDF